MVRHRSTTAMSQDSPPKKLCLPRWSRKVEPDSSDDDNESVQGDPLNLSHASTIDLTQNSDPEAPSTSSGRNFHLHSQLESYINTHFHIKAPLEALYLKLYNNSNSLQRDNRPIQEKIKKCLHSLLHTSVCKGADSSCKSPTCHSMKSMIIHTRRCESQITCLNCQTMRLLYNCHARFCSAEKCLVPMCTVIKNDLPKVKIRIKSELYQEDRSPDQTPNNLSVEEPAQTQDEGVLFNKLLANKICLCSLCNKFLKSPIIMVKNVGNICYACFHNSEFEEDSVQTNTSLEFIFNALVVPCKFTIEGCREKIAYVNLEEHERTCRFHMIECPVLTCDFLGPPENFKGHFKSAHGDFVISKEENLFVLNINLDDNVNYVRLLQGERDKSVFILITKDLQSDCLIYKMFNSVDEVQSQVYPLSKLFKTDESLDFKQVNINVLQDIISADSFVTLLIKVINTDNLDERMREYFECPVCNHLMRSPIYMCETGHSLCEVCKPQLLDCPSCRKRLPHNLRNFALEGLVELNFVKCAYGDQGCPEYLLRGEVNWHERGCFFKV